MGPTGPILCVTCDRETVSRFQICGPVNLIRGPGGKATLARSMKRMKTSMPTSNGSDEPIPSGWDIQHKSPKGYFSELLNPRAPRVAQFLTHSVAAAQRWPLRSAWNAAGLELTLRF